VQDVEWPSRPQEPVERREVDGSCALTAAEHQQAALRRAQAESLARGTAVGGGDGGRHRASGHEVPLPLEAGDRKRETDPPRPAREHAVGEAEMTVRLGQHQRQAHPERGDAGRRRDVAAPAQDGVDATPPERRARDGHRPGGESERAGCVQRVAPVDAPNAKEVDLVARGGNELGLGPVGRAEEHRLGAFSP
jgi:hypothetical protein